MSTLQTRAWNIIVVYGLLVKFVRVIGWSPNENPFLIRIHSRYDASPRSTPAKLTEHGMPEIPHHIRPTRLSRARPYYYARALRPALRTTVVVIQVIPIVPSVGYSTLVPQR